MDHHRKTQEIIRASFLLMIMLTTTLAAEDHSFKSGPDILRCSGGQTFWKLLFNNNDRNYALQDVRVTQRYSYTTEYWTISADTAVFSTCPAMAGQSMDPWAALFGAKYNIGGKKEKDSTGVSSMIANWPDVFRCEVGVMGWLMYLVSQDSSGNTKYASRDWFNPGTQVSLTYNSAGTRTGSSGIDAAFYADCMARTINTLYSGGMAYNMVRSQVKDLPKHLSIYEGLPDTINCGSDTSKAIYYISEVTSTGINYGQPHATGTVLTFTTAGVYSSKVGTGESSGCEGKSLTQLYSECRGYNVVDNRCSAASGKVAPADKALCVTCGVADCLLCSADNTCAIFNPGPGQAACVPCTGGQVRSNDFSICVTCDVTNCVTCSDDHKCHTCIQGYLPNSDGSLCQNCPNGQVRNNDLSKCVVCDVADCTTCSDDHKCHTCSGGKVPSADASKCVTCGVTDCNKCFADNKCQSCNNNKVVINENSKCISCNVADCVQCEDDNKCIKCGNGKVLSADKTRCVTCTTPYCSICESDNVCGTCNFGYATTAPDKKICAPCGNIDCLICVNNKCQTCVSGKLPSLDQLKCNPCTMAGCAACDEAGLCVKCLGVKALATDRKTCNCPVANCISCADDGKCLQCDTGLTPSSDGTKCFACNIADCVACSDPGKCRQCNSPKVLSSTQAECICPALSCSQVDNSTPCPKCVEITATTANVYQQCSSKKCWGPNEQKCSCPVGFYGNGCKLDSSQLQSIAVTLETKATTVVASKPTNSGLVPKFLTTVNEILDQEVPTTALTLETLFNATVSLWSLGTNGNYESILQSITKINCQIGTTSDALASGLKIGNTDPEEERKRLLRLSVLAIDIISKYFQDLGVLMLKTKGKDTVIEVKQAGFSGIVQNVDFITNANTPTTSSSSGQTSGSGSSSKNIELSLDTPNSGKKGLAAAYPENYKITASIPKSIGASLEVTSASVSFYAASDSVSSAIGAGAITDSASVVTINFYNSNTGEMINMTQSVSDRMKICIPIPRLSQSWRCVQVDTTDTKVPLKESSVITNLDTLANNSAVCCETKQSGSFTLEERRLSSLTFGFVQRMVMIMISVSFMVFLTKW